VFWSAKTLPKSAPADRIPENKSLPAALGQQTMKIPFSARAMPLLSACIILAQDVPAPVPLLKSGQPVNWWFVFKFNAASFPECGGVQRTCLFGGSVQPYKTFGQQFVFASSANGALQPGGGCLGDAITDPLGATFDQIYNGNAYYVLWNDQFYGDPLATQFAPAGHSKGMLAWNDLGDGMVLEVSTPSWPASGSAMQPRKTDGNTLGCVSDDDVLVSQHFFALKLNKADVAAVLAALANSSVVTDPANLQIVSNGGPSDIQQLVQGLGSISKSKTPSMSTLSSGVVLISKPSNLNVPPWQMVSALLGGVPLRVASWWTDPKIPTTTASTSIGCWDASLPKPGAVEIATTGTWQAKTLGFLGVSEPDGNHAKIGVSTSQGASTPLRRAPPNRHCTENDSSPECAPVRNACLFGTCPYVIFGDMNQQGSLSGPNCDSSQNARGGLFFVLRDPALYQSVQQLLQGQTAPQ
jgi:hypothetical protein